MVSVCTCVRVWVDVSVRVSMCNHTAGGWMWNALSVDVRIYSTCPFFVFIVMLLLIIYSTVTL